MENQVKLYRKNQLGVGTWRIWYQFNEGGTATLFYAHSTTLGGSEVTHRDLVTLNQSGRTIAQQVELEMNSRISRQRDKGYKGTLEEAKKGVTNQLGLMNPMLAQPLDKVKLGPRDFENAYVQRKYDGHRCLITAAGDDIVPYTRKGKPIDTIQHILDEVIHFLPNGMTMDGELYIHGMALQGISSIIKRQQPDNVKLHFHWYDVYDVSQPHLRYAERYELMCRMIDESRGGFSTLGIVPTLPVKNMEEAMAEFRRFRSEGYEGAILRLNNSPYQDAVRSKSLIKLKEWHDEEVTVLSARPSKEGWAILTCQMDSGKIFDTSAPGALHEKKHVLDNFHLYKGKRLTIEYASLTNDGLPFHASALRWREDL